MEIIKDSNRVSNDFYQFYFVSRKYRNRFAHRYKMPSDTDLLQNLKNNMSFIDELEKAIESLAK